MKTLDYLLVVAFAFGSYGLIVAPHPVLGVVSVFVLLAAAGMLWFEHRARLAEWLYRKLWRQATWKPYFPLEDYVNRYWVVPFKWLVPLEGPYRKDLVSMASRGYRVAQKSSHWVHARLHVYQRGDRERHLHDHPWWNITVVLRGGFWEALPVSRTAVFDWRDSNSKEAVRFVWRAPGSIIVRRATARHAIESVAEGCTTLFIYGKWTRDWGFHTPAGWVFWRTYLGVAEGEP